MGELYWRDEPEMPQGRSVHSMHAYNGKLYVTAYNQSSTSPGRDTLVFNQDGSWTTAAPMPFLSSTYAGYARTYLVNDSLYAITERAPVYVYDIASDTWTARTGSSPEIMSYAGVVVGEDIYFPNYQNLFYKYSTVDDTWTVASRSLAGRLIRQSAYVNGKIYLFSYPVGSLTQVYDIAADEWTYTVPINFPMDNQYFTATAHNDKIYICGGLNNSHYKGVFREIYVYDTNTDTISEGPILPTVGRASHAACILNDRLYISGGQATSFSLISLDVSGQEPGDDKVYILVEATEAAMLSGTRALENRDDYTWRPATSIIG